MIFFLLKVLYFVPLLLFSTSSFLFVDIKIRHLDDLFSSFFSQTNSLFLCMPKDLFSYSMVTKFTNTGEFIDFYLIYSCLISMPIIQFLATFSSFFFIFLRFSLRFFHFSSQFQDIFKLKYTDRNGIIHHHTHTCWVVWAGVCIISK